jgi:hypothetical protein
MEFCVEILATHNTDAVLLLLLLIHASARFKCIRVAAKQQTHWVALERD